MKGDMRDIKGKVFPIKIIGGDVLQSSKLPSRTLSAPHFQVPDLNIPIVAITR